MTLTLVPNINHQVAVEECQAYIYEATLKNHVGPECPRAQDPIALLNDIEVDGGFEYIERLPKHLRSQIFGWIKRSCQLGFEDMVALKGRYEAWEQAKKDPGRTGDRATEADYFKLFEKLYPGARRCLFSGEVMFRNATNNGRWSPVANYSHWAKVSAYEDKFFAHTKVEDYLIRWRDNMAAELLTGIPEWDKRNRIGEIAEKLTASNMAQTDIYELICDWGAKMIARIDDPWVRNRILIFQGSQELGKDWLCDALTGGITEPGLNYVRHTRLDDTGEIDQKLHKSPIFQISEFDRTAKTAVAQLKHLVTATELDERIKFDKASDSRESRCSFIASANPKDLLRDPTGNTRFILIELTSIGYPYPGVREITGWEGKLPEWANDRKQIVAQFKYLAQNKYRASKETEAVLRDYLLEATPLDPSEDLLDFWDNWASERCRSGFGNEREKGYYLNLKLSPFYDEVCRQFKLSRNEIQRRLTLAGRRKKTKHGNGYTFKYLEKEED